MFDGFFPQTSHDFLYNKRLLDFLFLIPGTRESKLLQTIESYVADQRHLPLRPIFSHGCIEETLLNILYIFNV